MDNRESQSELSLEEFSSVLKRNTNDLVCFITTEYGLMDVLVSNKGLTYEQLSLIQGKDNNEGRVRQLLDEMTRGTLSEQKKKAFLNALNKQTRNTSLTIYEARESVQLNMEMIGLYVIA